MKGVSGFSRMSKEEKLGWLMSQVDQEAQLELAGFRNFWHPNPDVQQRFDEFAENTMTNFYLPFGVAPNFLINRRHYAVPMVIEESSVVAAASLGAKFWLERGGFHTRVIATRKVGQVHFLWQGEAQRLLTFFESIRHQLLLELSPLTESMEQRGGGIRAIKLVDKTSELANYWQLTMEFETCDAMGANFINTILEEAAKRLQSLLSHSSLPHDERFVEVIMCILSNFTPQCAVEAWVECPVEELGSFGEMDARNFARRFHTAVEIARVDKSRAVTHNKGIMNGVDAVVLATGNDFRAIEACAHAWACEGGQYRSLSRCELKNGQFRFELRLPLALGTVGGLTKLHPLARASLKILGQPSAEELMQIAAAVGLAQNFSAVRSLVTTGIQRGHMKLHLLNVLAQLNADSNEKIGAQRFFQDKVISFQAVRHWLENHRKSTAGSDLTTGLRG